MSGYGSSLHVVLQRTMLLRGVLIDPELCQLLASGIEYLVVHVVLMLEPRL